MTFEFQNKKDDISRKKNEEKKLEKANPKMLSGVATIDNNSLDNTVYQ
jgi:hypothetical protein